MYSFLKEEERQLNNVFNAFIQSSFAALGNNGEV